MITLPLQISGIGDGYAWSAENVRVAIEGPHGFVWSSPWQAMYTNRLLPGQTDFNVNFQVGRAVFDQLKSTPVTLHLTFAWTQLRSGPVRRIDIPTHDFVVPGFGICSPDINWGAPRTQIDGITCRYALRQPRLTYVDTRWSEDPCSGSSTANADRNRRFRLDGNPRHGPGGVQHPGRLDCATPTLEQLE